MFNENLIEIKRLDISKIPCLLLTPKHKKAPHDGIIYYHGWTSSKDEQAFRMAIFAYLGYQVLIPDAFNHGERKNEYEKNLNEAERIMLTAIKSHDEYPFLRDYLKSLSIKTISVTGHSMGAITSGIVFATYQDILLSMPINGTNNLEGFEKQFREDERVKNIDIRQKLEKLDVIKRLDSIKDRPMLLLNGNLDEVVNPKSQREFYLKAKKLYGDKSLIRYFEFEQTAHTVNDKMLKSMAEFIKTYTED